MSDSGAYHHGDLRSALLRIASEEIERSGYEGLSLRRLAALAGVSHAAPYRHFPSRDELLLELALEGARRLNADYAAVLGLPPLEQLQAITRNYVRLAMDSPQLFRLMFGSQIVTAPQRRAKWRATVDPAFNIFRDAVRRLHPDAREAEVDVIQLRWWSLGHGLAQLALNGRLDRFPESGKTPEAFVEAALARLGEPGTF